MGLDSETNTYRIITECDCLGKCSILEIEQWYDNAKPQEVFISNYIRADHEYSRPILNKIAYKLKLIWHVLIGKDYFLWGIALDKKETIQAFKESVVKLDENVDYS